RKDRYWTGGLIVGYYFPLKMKVNDIIISYHKYTGYTKNAFELTNLMDLPEVRYLDKEQQRFNRGYWGITVLGLNKGYGGSFKIWNKHCMDLQHGIHFKIYNSYHYPIPRKAFWS